MTEPGLQTRLLTPPYRYRKTVDINRNDQNRPPLKGAGDREAVVGSKTKMDRYRKKTSRFTGYNSDAASFARSLRRKMTPQECRLWFDFLRGFSLKFYRQRPIGDYIADFYCSRLKLVIELDGSQHYTAEGMAYDEARTRAINEYGVSVVRFSNYDVDTNFEGVCEYICAIAKGEITVRNESFFEGR